MEPTTRVQTLLRIATTAFALAIAVGVNATAASAMSRSGTPAPATAGVMVAANVVTLPAITVRACRVST